MRNFPILKNKSKGLFGSIKNQGASKAGNRRHPFGKDTLFKTRRNKGRGLFPAVYQCLQQQYPARGQARGNNLFINNTFHQSF